MSKILLIGKDNDVLGDLKQKLSQEFSVKQVAMDDTVVASVYSIMKPDMIIVCSLGTNGADPITNHFLNTKTREPIMYIISEYEREEMAAKYKGERYAIVAPPIKSQDIIDKCYDMLAAYALASVSSGEEVVKKKILSIDDSAIILRSIQSILSNQYEVITAGDGTKGIVKAIENQPDLILLDYEMPRLSGVEVLKQLRECPATANIPVVFLTSVSDANQVKNALILKPQGYVLKPIDANKLMGKVEEVLNN